MEAERLGLRFEQLSQHLDQLDRPNLHHVAQYFTAVAVLLRRKRAQLDKGERVARENARVLAALPAYPDTPSGRRMRRAAEMKARNIELMRLAARGWSNDRLGRRFGISEGQVSRIVQGQLRLTRKEPP